MSQINKKLVEAQICSETINVGSIFVRDFAHARLLQANIYFLFLFDYGISQLFISSRNKIVTIKRYMSILSASYSCVKNLSRIFKKVETQNPENLRKF